jgi:hypothetical protein
MKLVLVSVMRADGSRRSAFVRIAPSPDGRFRLDPAEYLYLGIRPGERIALGR